MFDVVCMGNALVDITLNVPDSFISGLNLKKGIMTLNDDLSQQFILSSIAGVNKRMSPGGSSSNVASGVACLGGKSSFFGKVGLDNNGAFFEESLMNKGVITKITKSSHLNTGSAITFITSDGERTFSTYLGAAASLGKSDLIDLPEMNYFHVEAYLLEDPRIKEVLFNLCFALKEKGVKISFDLSDPFLIQRIRKTIDNFLPFVDVIFANESEAKEFTSKSEFEAAKILGSLCGVAVVKLGEKGSIIVSKNEELRIVPEVVEPVNTNGAGDAFAAGFLFSLSKGLSLQKSGDVASFLAREVVLVDGASLSKNLSDKVKEFF